MAYRMEKDSIGEIRVDADRLWGAQTQRSLENFAIGSEKMPKRVVRNLIQIKRAAALAHKEMEILEADLCEAIVSVCDDLLAGDYRDEFPLSVWQTGSGTQTNMNVNEVIAHMASEKLGRSVHPNDHVNKGQSSNDVFPSSMHLSAVAALESDLLPVLDDFVVVLSDLSEAFADVIKVGRTHLQDATPITLGQEISAWQVMIEENRAMIEESLPRLKKLALGGTAVGTGLNAAEGFPEKVLDYLNENVDGDFALTDNTFHALSAKDGLVHAHGGLKALATNMMKIANDVRWLASGPRAGLGELLIPQNEPGSSIMPGKVNPTQAEAMTMVAAQVMGNDTAVGIGGASGNFQLNVFMPMMIYNFLQSVELLADGIASFQKNCVAGLKPNKPVIEDHLNQSLMNVTALVPVIGYDKASEVAKAAYENGTSIKEEVLAMDLLTEEEFDQYMDYDKMV